MCVSSIDGRFEEIRNMDSCEPHRGAENGTQVLHKSTNGSKQLSHLPRLVECLLTPSPNHATSAG